MATYRLSETNYKLLRSLPLFKEQYVIVFHDDNCTVEVIVFYVRSKLSPFF